jgi:MFS family permease
MGCLIFANSTGLLGLFIGRTLIGAGSAFAFVGFSHVLRQYFPAKQFAFMIGFSETFGFIATAVGIVGMGGFIAHWGWRTFIDGAAIVGLLIALLCWIIIPNSLHKPSKSHVQPSLMKILTNYPIWLNGFFVGLSFSVVTVFGALWAVPFIQTKLNCSMDEASIVAAVYFIGTGLSCPLFGVLSNHVKNRKRLILTSCLVTASLLMLVLFAPITSFGLIITLMFAIGLFCGAYMLSYTISNELAPAQLQSTAMGFTNTLAVLSALILQPFVGYLLVLFNHEGNYSITDYQYALLIVPISLILASLLVLFLPDN